MLAGCWLDAGWMLVRCWPDAGSMMASEELLCYTSAKVDVDVRRRASSPEGRAENSPDHGDFWTASRRSAQEMDGAGPRLLGAVE
jgi:hypothetical protein